MLALSALCEGPALSALYEGFARGWACLHTACPERSRRARLPVPKIPAAKPCVSISSKLIEIKGLQVLHSGHLRKTGGRGSYQLVHTTDHPVRKTPQQSPAFPTRLSRAPFERDAQPLTNLTIFNNVQTIEGRVVWSHRGSFPNRPARRGGRPLHNPRGRRLGGELA
jgi:hypothetical protein